MDISKLPFAQITENCLWRPEKAHFFFCAGEVECPLFINPISPPPDAQKVELYLSADPLKPRTRSKKNVFYTDRHRCECDGRGRTGALALLPMCGPVAVRGSDRSGAHRLEAVLEAKTWLGYG